jgi:hypothetical protein
MSDSITSGNSPAVAPGVDTGTNAVINALRGLRYGSVEVVVHNGRIVQIERREKVRVEPNP